MVGSWPVTDNLQQGLINDLLDTNAEFGDRSDAAMDLGQFDGETAEQALASVANDPRCDVDLVELCRESLTEISARKKT